MSLDVYYFTEMPYHYIDDELAEQWPSLRLTFPNSYFDPNKATDLFKRYLDEFQYAEEVGFQGLMINEHHNTPSCMDVEVNITGGILARLGGDEFICVVPYHPKVPDRVDQLATRMIEHVARPVEYGDTPVDVTMSIGIASSTQMENARDGEDAAERLMHKSDIAMYHAKKQGKNRFYWFEPQMENELRFRNELEAGIRRGIVNGDKVDVAADSGKCVLDGVNPLVASCDDFDIHERKIGPKLFLEPVQILRCDGDDCLHYVVTVQK